MADLIRLTAREAARRIARGELSGEELVRACAERIAVRDEAVRAWACFSREHALEQARHLDSAGKSGVLRGLPIGVKDIIDTDDQPTAYGSPIYAGHVPAADAASVALARTAGAVIMGKTVTTEFAYRRTGPTTNPHDARHTPGGSSSGSAAAVADFQVPLAFGTQTGGSTIRPAAYCGIVGYKPTYGDIPVAGAKPIAASFDTITMFARTVDDVAFFRSALTSGEPDGQAVADGVGSSPRIGFCRTSVWDEAEAAQKSAVEAAAARLSRAGASVTDVDLAGDARHAHLLQDTIFSYEMSRSLAAERLRHSDRLSKVLHEEGLPPGDRISTADYHDACRRLEQARSAVDALFDDRYDVLITSSATGEAPLGLQAAGSAIFCLGWSGLHVPAISIPVGKGPKGLPLGLQIVGRRRDDRRTLAFAAWIAERLDSMN
jgi:Asp-tRNA(Asn)/Glu-tRNA(Gln) amidotransferase A subunit family amidase